MIMTVDVVEDERVLGEEGKDETLNSGKTAEDTGAGGARLKSATEISGFFDIDRR